MHRSINATPGAFHFRVARMADDYDLHPLSAVPSGLEMYLGDQGAGSVDSAKLSSLGLIYHKIGNTVGAKYGHRTQRNLIQVFDKKSTAISQSTYNMAIMNNLMEHIHRGAVRMESLFYCLDSADYSSTKSPWLSKNNFHISHQESNAMSL
jgi:hypothetical protein